MEALDAQDPRAVGDYRILGRLGEGGMGRVYLARNAGGRSVALKFIHADMAAAPGFRERFRREVEVVGRIAGAGTVPVVDAGVDEQHPWYASEYVPGPSLQDAVERFGPLPADALWRFAADLAETLEHVHGKNLVHRDLKPSNVLLSTAGPRLIDFGIVHAALDTMLTSSGARIGTPAYMSPEQAYGERITAASDIYSYGLTLAFAATGQVPHRGTLASQLPGVDRTLVTLILHCLDPDPARRPDAAQLCVQARAFDPTTDTWLPAQVASLIARTSEELLNLEAHAGPGPRTRTHADPGAFFHDAPTQGPAPEGPGAPRTPPPPPYQPPRQTPYVSNASYPSWQTPPPMPTGTGPVPGSWVHRGLLGHPLLGLPWLVPLGSCSLLMALALPTVMGWIRLLALVALTALSVWLMSSRARDDIARWFRLTQIFWLALAFFEVQGWYAAGQYDSDLLYATVSDGNASMFQTLVGSLLDILQLFLMLGSLALVYVVPAAIGRWMRLRRDGF